MTKYIKLNGNKCHFLSFEDDNGVIANIKLFDGNKWCKATSYYSNLVVNCNALNKIDLLGKLVSKEQCEDIIKEKLFADNKNIFYIKLKDKDATILSFEKEKTGIISNIRMFDKKEWKTATPFYIQLVLLASRENKLDYFGYVMTKETCDFEIEVKKSYSDPETITTVGGK